MRWIDKVRGKIECEQCSAVRSKSQTRSRRSLRFCSEPCEQAFVARFPIKPSTRSEQENRDELAMLLIAAEGELKNASLPPPVVRATGSRTHEDAAQAAVASALSHLMSALPSLYALGRDADALYIERIDTDPIAGTSYAPRLSFSLLLGGLSSAGVTSTRYIDQGAIDEIRHRVVNMMSPN
jgi:hypothetical protein